MIPFAERAVAAWDRFLFASCDPRIVPVLRIGYALLVLIHTSVVWIHADRWFSDTGVMRVETARQIISPMSWSLFYVLPSSSVVVHMGLTALLLHALLMLLGIWSRFQAAAIFFWLVSFQNRNPFILDGEDAIFRIFAFLMIWLPLDAYWAMRRPANRQSSTRDPDFSTAWGLRLIQMEITAVYASTALVKFQGSTWHDGTALWYVSRMTDHFGRLIPASWFDELWLSAGLTWGALAIETALPIALWFRPTRKFAILAGLALHLGIELTMHIFLFQWVMMLGLLAFVQPSEWRLWKRSTTTLSVDLQHAPS